jgi:hypothetical protein
MKIALCCGTSMALVSDPNLKTSLNRNVKVLNSFLYLLLFFDDLPITAAQTNVTKYRYFC